MIAYDKGILPDSYIYLYQPSETAKRLFFYPLCCGKYHCSKEYTVSRTSFDSFLLIYVLRGKGYVKLENHTLTRTAGQFALINCYEPHEYGTDSGWDILWIHFDGPMAFNYYQEIIPRLSSMEIKDPDSLRHHMEKVYNLFHNKTKFNETELSKYMYSVMADLLMTENTTSKEVTSDMEEIRSYMANNLDKQLSLDDLAKRANLSNYYFTRVFKKEIGYTPHEYLILLRMNAAKFYLRTTSLSVKDISYQTGFLNECSFCTCFKKTVGTTPASYRAQVPPVSDN